MKSSEIIARLNDIYISLQQRAPENNARDLTALLVATTALQNPPPGLKSLLDSIINRIEREIK